MQFLPDRSPHEPRLEFLSLTPFDKAKAKAPARSLVSIDDVGVATAFLAHDAARLITGETLYVDGGYHIID
jgi:enoyl-[acyl-carrier-protein] reductase (NADH)